MTSKDSVPRHTELEISAASKAIEEITANYHSPVRLLDYKQDLGSAFLKGVDWQKQQ